MAIGLCWWCKRSNNAAVCTHCGGPMILDEIFDNENGGAFPTIQKTQKSVINYDHLAKAIQDIKNRGNHGKELRQ